MELLYSKGPVPLQKIGEKILITSGSITYVVDKLAVKGLINRLPCHKDKRVIYAEISPEGSRLISTIFPGHKQVIQDIFSGLTSQEKFFLIEGLKKAGYKAKEMY